MRVITAIDQVNIQSQLRDIGRKTDLLTLRQELFREPERIEIDTYIYTPIPHHNPDTVLRWHDYLRSQGFIVVAKRVKQYPDGGMKCNLDGELILDMVSLAQDARPDIVVIVSGDGDFASLCHYLRRKGIRVEVASLPGEIASELKLAAHRIIDLSAWAATCQTFGPDSAAG